MLRRWLPALVVMVFAGGALLRADEVYVRGKDKPIKGKIKSEDAKEVKVGLKEIIPADQIVDIVYELSTVTPFQKYKNAQRVEKESLDPAKEANRKVLLDEAVLLYTGLLPMLAANDRFAKRHGEYKIAMLKARQVQEDGASPKDALARLREFAKNHPTSWQITNVYETLGRMQMDAGDYAGAEKTYTKMADLVTLPEETRMDARMLAVQAKLRAKKYDEARSDIAELQRGLDKSSRFYVRTKVAEAECLVAQTASLGKEDAKRQAIRAGGRAGTRRHPAVERRLRQGGGPQHAGLLLRGAGQGEGRDLGVPVGGRGVQPGSHPAR